MLLAKRILWISLILVAITILAVGIYLIISGNSNALTDKGIFV